jgi:hypothetical protein
MLVPIIFVSHLLPYNLVAQCKCCSEEYRQFDFWIGEWEVSNEKGLAGKSSITLSGDSCTVLEKWSSATSSFSGTSRNFYDMDEKQWKQVWTDNQGGSLNLSGGLIDGAMVLTSTQDSTMDRITWRPYDEGSVRQHWERSDNLGKDWTTLFDGLYRK